MFAGYNPHSLRGSTTAVIVGAGFDDTTVFMVNELHRKNALVMPGTARNMIANMTSFAFDFKGKL